MNKVVILIPSRLSAQRLPGKPLLNINGLPLISHVVNRGQETKLGDVIVCAEDKEIILEDITVSKNHAYISVDDDNLEIYDEGSTNGIFVNGELTESSKLYPGTRLQIGKYYLVISTIDK